MPPLISGPEQAHRMVPTHHRPMMNAFFAEDRLGRMNGDTPMTMPVVASDPASPCAIPDLEAWDFCQPYLTPSETERKDGRRNEVTLRSLEEIQGYTAPAGGLAHITPTPVLMGVAKGDMVAPVDLLLRNAREMCEPKEVVVVEGDILIWWLEGRGRGGFCRDGRWSF